MLALLRYANRKTRNVRVLRKLGVLAYSSMMRANVFLPPPKVFLNGPGKSGTHLLSDCLSLLPAMMFSGRHFSLAEYVVPPVRPDTLQFNVQAPYVALDRRRLDRLFRACRDGTFVSAHAGYHPELQEILKRRQFSQILLFRDPRDIAVSYSHFVLREPGHHHHAYYRDVLRDDDERLLATIRGFEGTPEVAALASIGTMIQRFVAWSEDPSVLVCKFEDLVGPRGGGSPERQLQEIRRVAHHLDRPLTEQQASVVAERMYSEKSLTFRKGSSGQWSRCFNDAHRRAFKEVAGPLLVQLGYETDDNW